VGTERPWVRGELPWLGSGPLFRVHSDSLGELDAFLDRFGYERVELDGRRMTSRLDAHAELARAFDFPDYYGKNWDAFNDCMRDVVHDHDGTRFAVLWRHVEAAASAAPATTVEVGWALLETASGAMPTLRDDDPSRIALDVFCIGDGADFDRAG